VVATKVGLRMSDGRPNDRGLSRKHIFDQVDQSLGRLGMDYIDLLYIHRLDPDTEHSRKCSMRSKPSSRPARCAIVAASSMWAWQFAKLREMQKARATSNSSPCRISTIWPIARKSAR
jgi:aryl-alcohol dehydrogenase-like predicted oxidoreductase